MVQRARRASPKPWRSSTSASRDANSTQEALSKCDIDAVAESDFEFEQWISDLVIERIEDETGTLIACDYEDHVTDIDDL
ncbi:hypothetical protein [Xanthomonas campestris]|uniref:hypothetical protein n=1 Tax=Xanthomonas campestris TaxID=339 RepID=UPI0023689FD9|nr:hypothetical protein [Xanthomonas campestris]